MATMADLDALALALPGMTKEMSEDGRPSYNINGTFACFHRRQRADAVDPKTGERLSDVLVFRVADLVVKDLLLSDTRGIYFTTPHFKGYTAVLVRIPDLARLDRDDLEELVIEAWLTRAPKCVAKAWLAEHEPDDGGAAASGNVTKPPRAAANAVTKSAHSWNRHVTPNPPSFLLPWAGGG